MRSRSAPLSGSRVVQGQSESHATNIPGSSAVLSNRNLDRSDGLKVAAERSLVKAWVCIATRIASTMQIHQMLRKLLESPRPPTHRGSVPDPNR